MVCIERFFNHFCYLTNTYNYNYSKAYYKYKQNGGSKKYNLTFVEKDTKDTKDQLYKISFDVIFDEYNKKILLSNSFGFNCIVIAIDEKLHLASIDNISSDTSNQCIELEDFNLKNPGNFYLKMAIKMLIKYKDKFKINKISLQDNAQIICNQKRYNLSQFLLLTRGETFYGRYGFEPKDIQIKTGENNIREIIKKLKIKDINWLKVINQMKDRNEKEYKKYEKEYINLIKYFDNNKDENYIKIMSKLFNKENKNICYLYFMMEPYLKNYIFRKNNIIFDMLNQTIRELDIKDK